MPAGVRRGVREMVETAVPGGVAGRALDPPVVAPVPFDGVAAMLETGRSTGIGYEEGPPLMLEGISVGVCGAGYALRLRSCNAGRRSSGVLKGRPGFAATPLAAVDLLAVPPTYLPLSLPVDLRVPRAARLFRVFPPTGARVVSGSHAAAGRGVSSGAAGARDRVLLFSFDDPECSAPTFIHPGGNRASLVLSRVFPRHVWGVATC